MTNHQQPTADDHRKRQLTLPFERAEQAAQLRQRILASAPIPDDSRRLLLAIAAHPGRAKSDRARAYCVASLRELLSALKITCTPAARIRLQRLIGQACQNGWLRRYANFRTFAGQYAGQKPNVYRICYARLRRLPDQRETEAQPETAEKRHLRQSPPPESQPCPPGTRSDGIVCPPRTDFAREVCPPLDRNFAEFSGVRGGGARPPARIPQKQEKTTTTTNLTNQSKTTLFVNSWGFRATNADLHKLDKVRRMHARAVAVGLIVETLDDAAAFLALVLWVRDQPPHDPVINPRGIRYRPGWLLWAIRGDDWRGWAEPAHWSKAHELAPRFLNPDERSNPDA